MKTIPTKVKNKLLVNDLFPEFTSDKDQELIAKWSSKKTRKDGTVAESLVILPDDREVMMPDDFDIRALMDSAQDPVTGTLRNLKIDDRDLAWAKNYYDYSYKIIGRDANPPWSRQMWTGLLLFGEVCTACTKPKWLDIENIPKDFDSEFLPDMLTLLEHGVCPCCKRHKWDLIKNHKLNNYQQLVNVLGQRSGKSSSAAGGYATYLTHQYLKFPDLGSMAKSDMQASTELTGTFVSLNFAKAIGVIWTPYVKMMEASSWFKEYFRLLDHNSGGHGKELYRRSSMYLKFHHKNLRFYPSGPRSTTLRGDTRIFAVLDELGLFPLPKGDAEEDEQSERANADEAHKSLARSLTTVQGIRQRLMKEGVSSVPGCALMNVSSPIAQRDKVMRLLRQSKTEEGSHFILGINLPTWEINPGMERDHPTIALAYLENREMAERDYGANPPSVHSQFIPRNAFENDVFVGGQNSHVFKPLFDIPGQIYGKVEKIRTVRWPSVITLDAGHCVTGGTLIPTENGLLRIDEIASHTGTPTIKDIKLKVGSRLKPAVAAQWHYVGKYPTRVLFTKSGHTLKATYVHPQLVLRDGAHIWVPMGDLRINDLVCVNPVQLVRTKKLPLDLKQLPSTLPTNNTTGMKNVYRLRDSYVVIITVNGVRKNFYASDYDGAVAIRDVQVKKHAIENRNTTRIEPTTPAYMTPELAFIIGALISEGSFGKYRTDISNSNVAYLKKLKSAFKKVFNLDCLVVKTQVKGDSLRIKGKDYIASRDVYQLIVCSRTLCSWWENLGLKSSAEHGRRSAFYKVVPWSILQADADSQLSFLAAYIEGDGSIRKDRHQVLMFSSSQLLLRQMQVLVNAHGIMSNISYGTKAGGLYTASATDGFKLYWLLEPHLTHKRRPVFDKRSYRPSKLYGFSSEYLREFAKSRHVKSTNVDGAIYVNDDGVQIRLLKGGLFQDDSVGSRFLYESFDVGVYDKFLSKLRLVSKVEYEKLFTLFKCRYWYTPIVALRKGSKEDVYDLSMKTGAEPAFIANGMIIHNTNNSFTITGEHYDFDSGKTVVSTVIEIMPVEGRTINFNLVYQHVILPIAKDINAVAMLADQWQGIDLLYRIEEDMGNNPLGKVRCKAKQYSPRRRDFDTMVAMMRARNVIMPTVAEHEKQEIFDGNISDYRVSMINKPVQHLFLQMNTIQDTGEGRCPTKGDGYTDDILRALVLGVSKIHEPKLMDRLKIARSFIYENSGRQGMPMPAFAGRSGSRYPGLR